MRTFLRLDFLYQQALYPRRASPTRGRRGRATGSLLEILAITARGDIRSEVLKELERQMAVMHEYQSTPGVDRRPPRRPCCRTSLRLRTELNRAGATFLQPLRDSEFLNAIKHRSAIPGGTCEFDLPDYRHWLEQPCRDARGDVQRMDVDDPAARATPSPRLLWLTRAELPDRARRARARRRVPAAVRARESDASCCASRCRRDTDLFPEISGSHHRCSMRFLTSARRQRRPTQTTTT